MGLVSALGQRSIGFGRDITLTFGLYIIQPLTVTTLPSCTKTL